MPAIGKPQPRSDGARAAKLLADIDLYSRGLLEQGLDSLALPADTRALVEAIAKGKTVASTGTAQRALEAADALRSELGWRFLDTIREACWPGSTR